MIGCRQVDIDLCCTIFLPNKWEVDIDLVPILKRVCRPHTELFSFTLIFFFKLTVDLLSHQYIDCRSSEPQKISVSTFWAIAFNCNIQYKTIVWFNTRYAQEKSEYVRSQRSTIWLEKKRGQLANDAISNVYDHYLRCILSIACFAYVFL